MRNIPGLGQRPGVRFYMAATGPRGLKLAAEYRQGSTILHTLKGPADVPVEQAPGMIVKPAREADDGRKAAGRDAGELAKVLPQGGTRRRSRCSPSVPSSTGSGPTGRWTSPSCDPLAGARVDLREQHRGLRADRHREPGPARLTDAAGVCSSPLCGYSGGPLKGLGGCPVERSRARILLTADQLRSSGSRSAVGRVG